MAAELDSEKRRVFTRPDGVPRDPLALLVVHPAIAPPEYATRLRHLISAALTVTDSTDDLPGLDPLPPWFTRFDEVAYAANRRYSEARAEEPWTIREWVGCFAPPRRQWSWWDLTLRTDGTVAVWADTLGAPHPACEELWWALYVSGARAVDPLTLEEVPAWQAEARGPNP
ncbi:hypothetical protein [Nocardia sp. NPDC057668]|uniref:hypothetical protein n=1 Tax=Nocardia sp. NPDC057668 TaxID=3346202 RepID=UPI0036726ACD